MTADEYKTVVDFEDTVTVGSKVCVSLRGIYRGTCEVMRINPKSFRVKLADDGELNIPRIDDIRKWSANNRIEPLGGYVVATAKDPKIFSKKAQPILAGNLAHSAEQQAPASGPRCRGCGANVKLRPASEVWYIGAMAAWCEECAREEFPADEA